MSLLRTVLLAILVTGCDLVDVNGTSDESPDGDDPSHPGQIVTVTITQTPDETIDPLGGVGCWACLNMASPCTRYTEETSFYRVFDLVQHGVTRPLQTAQVTFAVVEARGAQMVQVKVGTYMGSSDALDLTSVTPLASTTVNIPSPTDSKMIVAPLIADVPAASKLVVEVLSPSHKGEGNVVFYLGTTRNGETGPGYVRAPICNRPDPVTTAALGVPDRSAIISVTGSYEQ